MGSIALPEHVAGIVIAADGRAGDFAQPQHRLRTVHDEARMHFDRDLHAVIFGEFGVLDPIRLDFFLPLPREDVEIFRRPRAGHPVRIFRLVGIAGAARKIDHDGHFQLFGKPDGELAGLGVSFGDGFIGMQRIAMRAERADGKSVVGEFLLELFQRDAILQHRQLAMRIAGIISGAQFDGRDVQGAQFFEHFFERELR